MVSPEDASSSPAPRASHSAQGVRAIAALVLGFIVGVVVRAASPRLTVAMLAVADPVGSLWVNAIRMTVIPLVVSLMVTGIAQSTGTGAVARLGGRALAIFAGLLCVTALITALAAPPIFQLLHVDAASAATLRASVAASNRCQTGLTVSRVVVEAMGESEPVASNASVAGRAANRRVEIVLHPRAG